MSKSVLFIFVIALFSIGVSGQPKAVENRFVAENALAEKVLAAHGGEKLRSMKSLVVRGSVDITASNFPQAIPAGSRPYSKEVNTDLIYKIRSRI